MIEIRYGQPTLTVPGKVSLPISAAYRFGQYRLMPGRQTMASDRPQAPQDTFLDHVRKHEVPVTIFLASGIKLQGYVREFDSYSLLLVRDRQAQLIYKHAVSTLMPGEPVRIPQTSDDQGLPRLEVSH